MARFLSLPQLSRSGLRWLAWVTSITLVVTGVLTASAPVVSADPVQPTPKCVRLPSEDYGRDLTARRDGTSVHVGFFRTENDARLDVVRYEMYIVHDGTKAKSGDRRVGWYDHCGVYSSISFDHYKPSSTLVCAAPCTQWAFTPVFKGVRDEAMGFILIGKNRGGQRVVLRYVAFGERLAGTAAGKLLYFRCVFASLGLPTAQSLFLLSRATLNGINLFGNKQGRALADVGLVAVDGVALSVNVDPNTGEVEQSYTLEVKRAKYEAKVIVRRVKEWAKTRSTQPPNVVIKRVGAAYSVVVTIKNTYQSSRAFLHSVASWNQTRKTSSSACAGLNFS